MDAADLVNHVPQQITTLHAVIHAAEHSCDHIPAIVAIRACKLAQIGEEPRSSFPIRSDSFVLVNEGKQFVAGYALRAGSPVTPTVGVLDCRTELLAGECGLLLPLDLKIIQEFQEHDPGQQRQPIEVPVQPLVLAHYGARGFQKGPERLCGRRRWTVGRSCWFTRHRVHSAVQLRRTGADRRLRRARLAYFLSPKILSSLFFTTFQLLSCPLCGRL